MGQAMYRVALHTDSDGHSKNRSRTWSLVADVVKPPRTVFFEATRV